MRRGLVALIAGFVFAIGLGMSGMTQPAKVVGFLDVAGAWDPTLAFVMAGALGVHVLACALSRRVRAPLLGATFDVPGPGAPIDRALVVGAAVFGVGWGLAGYCPGPGIVSAGAGAASAVVFVGAMIAGMALVGARGGRV